MPGKIRKDAAAIAQYAAQGGLTDRQQELYLAYWINGMSAKEAAGVLNCSVGAVNVAVSRLRTAVKQGRAHDKAMAARPSAKTAAERQALIDALPRQLYVKVGQPMPCSVTPPRRLWQVLLR